MTHLDALPLEILEKIAYFACTSTLAGPPSSILSILTLNHQFYGYFSFQNNPHLYARIFCSKFDLAAPLRRLGSDELTVMALADELQWRYRVLKKIKAKDGCLLTSELSPTLQSNDHSVPSTSSIPISTNDVLWTAYLMLLENDGKNDIQLREYARLDEWIKTYWFHPNGASGAGRAYEEKRWPSWGPVFGTGRSVSLESLRFGGGGNQCVRGDGEENELAVEEKEDSANDGALAMWLFWFLLRPETFAQDQELYRAAMYILKPLALGAFKYPLSYAPWTKVYPQPYPNTSSPASPTSPTSTSTGFPIWLTVDPTILHPMFPHNSTPNIGKGKAKANSSSVSSSHCQSQKKPIKSSLYYNLTNQSSHNLTPLPLATPAILAYLSLANHLVPHAAQQGDLAGFGFGAQGLVGLGVGVTPLSLPSSPISPVSPYSPISRSSSANTGERWGSQSEKWETEWARCVVQGGSRCVEIEGRIGYLSPRPSFGPGAQSCSLGDVWKPGSIEGIWEGMFTYTEFTSYAALLSGAGPHILQKSLVAQHRQTWKLREYHLLADIPSTSSMHQSLSPQSPFDPSSFVPDSSSEIADTLHDLHLSNRSPDSAAATNVSDDDNEPFPVGLPTRGFVPLSIEFIEHESYVEVIQHNDEINEFGEPVQEQTHGIGTPTSEYSPSSIASPDSPSRRRGKRKWVYKRYDPEIEKTAVRCAEGGAEYRRRVRDVLILGEGHSTWGQFRLMGRVRPYDGFLSIAKDYLDDDRGSWLYRGYLVGGPEGNFAGRWRDTLSPSGIHGYEGCFGMARRR